MKTVVAVTTEQKPGTCTLVVPNLCDAHMGPPGRIVPRTSVLELLPGGC